MSIELRKYLVCVSSSMALLLLATSCGTKAKVEVPVVFNATPTAWSGDLVHLQGARFGQQPLVQFASGNSEWHNLTPVATGSDALTVTVPENLPGNPGLIALRVSADAIRWSDLVYINRAKGLHFGTAQIAPGQMVRLFGRNLKLDSRPVVKFVDLMSGASFLAKVDENSSRSYALSFVAPETLVPLHRYEVFVSNGSKFRSTNDDFTRAEEVLLCKKSGVDHWNLGVSWVGDLDFYKNVIDARTDTRLKLHAKGDGVNNDAPALQQAIDLASSSGGGVVYLPKGAYRILSAKSCALVLQSRVVLAGAGMDQTVIKYGYGAVPKSGGYSVCFAYQSSGLIDMAFENINESGHWPESALADNAKSLFMKRVRWNIGTSQWISLLHSENLAIEDCDISQGISAEFHFNGPLALRESKHILLSGNKIRYAAWGLDFGNIEDGVFENNVVTRYAAPPGLPNHVTHVIAASFARNFAVLKNRFQVEGTILRHNDGETILSEGGGPFRFNEYRGVATRAENSSLIDDKQNFRHPATNAEALRAGAVVEIVKGTGTGQWRTVTSVSENGHSLGIDRPWTVTPEPGSRYATFSWSAENWTIVENAMKGNEKGIEFFNASAREILIANNNLENNSGIMFSPDQGVNGQFSVVQNIRIAGNTIRNEDGNRPAHITLVPREDGQAISFGTAVFAAEIRENEIVASVPNTAVRNSDDEKAVVEGINCYWQ
jgi:hypothetical protein